MPEPAPPVAYLLDLDGTLYAGGEAVPGAVAALSRLRSSRVPFRLVTNTTSRSRESGGTGLGLAIVKHVLNLHQARLEITSEVGRGSTFACHFGAERVRTRTADTGRHHEAHA